MFQVSISLYEPVLRRYFSVLVKLSNPINGLPTHSTLGGWNYSPELNTKNLLFLRRSNIRPGYWIWPWNLDLNQGFPFNERRANLPDATTKHLLHRDSFNPIT